MKATVWLLS